MKEFINEIIADMNDNIKGLSEKENPPLQVLRQKIYIINRSLTKLKTYILEYTFADSSKEIEFFKSILPPLYGDLIFHKKLLELEINCPLSHTEKEDYYKKALQHIGDFFERKKHLIVYYRTGANYLDHHYFLRNQSTDDPITSSHSIVEDTRFSTPGSIYFARINASQKLVTEIEKRLAILAGKESFFPNEEAPKSKRIKWEGAKVWAVQLGYALKKAGIFNETLQEIFECFEECFSIKLGNTSRTFQEILARKKEENDFLDKLAAIFKEYSDKTNQNYKPRK